MVSWSTQMFHPFVSGLSGLVLLAGLTAALLPGSASGENITLNARIYGADGQRLLGAAGTETSLETLFGNQKQIVFKLLQRLGIDKATLPKEVVAEIEKPQTTSMAAFVSYSVGLDKLDRGDYQGARTAFEQAVKLDPGFSSATRYARTTPRLNQSLSQMMRASLEGDVTRSGELLGNDNPQTLIRPPDAPPPQASPAPAAGSGDIAGDLGTLVEQTAHQVQTEVQQQVSQEMSNLADAVRMSPEQAQNLLAESVQNGTLPVEQAMAAALDGMGAMNNPQALSALVDTAIRHGITLEATRELVNKIRATSPCR